MTDRCVVTDEHMKLLRRANIRWEHQVEYGAPGLDQKRPYGNSDVPRDIYEILGWPLHGEEGDEFVPWSDERAMAIHREMVDVLQILCSNPGTAIQGLWIRDDSWYAWRRPRGG